nr:MAG TPA: hypothetical protein [Caudoviricetes sp.]
MIGGTFPAFPQVKAVLEYVYVYISPFNTHDAAARVVV